MLFSNSENQAGSEITSGTRNRSKNTILIKVRRELVLIKPAKFPVTWVEGEMQTIRVGKKTLCPPFMLSCGFVNEKMKWNGDEWIQSWELDSIPGLTKRSLYLPSHVYVTQVFSGVRLPYKRATSSHISFLVIKMMSLRLKNKGFPRGKVLWWWSWWNYVRAVGPEALIKCSILGSLSVSWKWTLGCLEVRGKNIVSDLT